MNRRQRISRELACAIGRLRLRLRARWVPPLGGLLLIIVLVGATDFFFAKTSFPLFMELNKDWNHKLGDWLNIWMILAIYTIAWLLFWSMQARSRMVVEQFVNYAGKDFEDAANGASMMLLVKLGQLHDLYQAVDEQRAISTAAQDQSIPLEHYTAIDAAINVDTVGAFLKDAISTQSTLNVGPLQIPIGTLLSLIGRVAQGPRIIGSFQKDRNQAGKNLLILTAQAMRNGKSFTWRVERELSSEQLLSTDLTDMISEFGCRIFTDMTLSSTVRWRAAVRFTEGLRAYRECLRTPKDRIGNLQLAEEKFIETLAEDTQYTLAHYNLGVVLTELQRKEAATAAFERAIGEDPRSSQAYYALALSCYQNGQFYRASQLCKRVIVDLKADPGSIARAYQLKAMALAEQEYSQDSNKTSEDAIKNCMKAIKYAHKALRRAEITQQDDAPGFNDRVLKAETLLSVCIGSLAKIYLPRLLSSNVPLSSLVSSASGGQKLPHLHEAKKLLNAALQLHSSDTCYHALYHWELSRILCAEGKCKEAAHHSRIAVRAAPDRIEYLADLIFNQAHALATSTKDDPSKILDLGYEEFLFQTLLDLISTTKKETVEKETVEKALETVLNAYKQGVPAGAKYEEKGRCVRMIGTFLQLGRTLGAYATQEELDRMTGEQLAERCEQCKRQYDTCTAQCYNCNGECQVVYPPVNNKSTTVPANGSAPALMPNQKQQVIDPATGKINKMLCLSQIALAWGRIQLQLSRKEQNETDPVGGLLILLGDLDAQVQSVNNQPEWEWERGQILSILATLYYETGKRKQEMGEPPDSNPFEKAACYYRKAIELLQEKYPRGISVQNLRSSLASVLLELRDQQQEALKVAQKSITVDAMNYKNYETLGEVYFACADFSNAIETWKQAIARKNTTAAEINDPKPYMRLGNAYVALAQSRHGICLNDQQCQEAVRYLEHALKCCTDEHVPERLKIYCSLGYLHYTRGDYDQAIQYLRLTQSFGFAPCTSSFYLADAHLRKKDYDAAFKQFRILQEKTEVLKGDPDEILEADSSGHICLNEMKALAFWGQVYTLVERDIYHKDLLRMAECASRLAEQVPLEKLQFPSRYAHCEGWLLYKLDQLEPPEKSNGTGDSRTTNGEKAIEILLKAARLEALPEIYLHLAQACQNKLPHLSDASEKQRLLANIRAYCQHARDLNGDNDKSLNLQLDDLLKSLPA
jgi:tetratricopeptide (TPR) repeat protein